MKCCRNRWPLTLRSCFGIGRSHFLYRFRRTSAECGTKPTDIQAISIPIYCFIYKLKHMFVDPRSPSCPPPHSAGISSVTTLIYSCRISPTLFAFFSSPFSLSPTSLCVCRLHRSLVSPTRSHLSHLTVDSTMNASPCH